jgi:hypothetical protein
MAADRVAADRVAMDWGGNRFGTRNPLRYCHRVTLPTLDLLLATADTDRSLPTEPAGSVVTTGTTGALTDAQPLSAGQHWRTAIDGVPLSGLSLKVNA